MTNDADPRPASKQSDVLLWLAAAGIGALALTWLLMLQPWRADEVPVDAPAARTQAVERPESSERAAASAAASARRASGSDTRLDSGYGDPLKTAELALEAGMLVEPERHSAWSLYAGVLDSDPGNEAASAGLARVAELLVVRADTALEQGRVDDARATAELILARIADHAAAVELVARIEEATRPPPPPEPEPEQVAANEEAPARPPEPDPAVVALEAAHTAFEEAMLASRLLTPAAASARHFVDVMADIDADDERAVAARNRLFEELLSRSRQALEALDATAARTWIDEAERLDVDSAAVRNARDRLVDTLVAQESERRLPVSSLELIEYVPPEYPTVAARRDVEGWVEVEFTVARDGSTRDIAVVDSSHETVFQSETVTAVEQWRFEPRVFMDRRIDQRAFTRIRFNLD